MIRRVYGSMPRHWPLLVYGLGTSHSGIALYARWLCSSISPGKIVPPVRIGRAVVAAG